MLGELLQNGDLVSVTIDPESREWGYNPCENGAVAEVLGFSEIYFGRLDNCGLRPGVHHNYCYANIRFITDGKQCSISTHSLKLVDETEYEKRRSLPRPKTDRFIRDLPETALWESDVVEARGERLVVVRISYDCLDKKTDYGSPWPVYDCSNKIDGGWYKFFREDELTLLERGPVWCLAHGYPVEFESIEEKAKLFYRMGHTDQLKNPTSGNYAWTKDQVLDALRDGSAHGFLLSHGLFGSDHYCGAMRYHDEELGRQVAAETLKGFGG